MRKLISMGMLALFLCMLAAPAFAGNVEDCEVLKDGDFSKGLYGLCIAYHNAGSENAKARILANYNKKATGDDPDMPGLESKVVTCPCLDALAGLNSYDWGFPVSCTTFGTSDSGLFVDPAGNPEFFNFTTLFTVDSDGETHFCSIMQTLDTDIFMATAADEYDACLDELVSRCP